MTINPFRANTEQDGAAESGPFIIENGVAYLRAPFTLASTAAGAPAYVVIDGIPYIVVSAPVPGSTPVTPTVPVSPANPVSPVNQAAQTEGAVPAQPVSAAPVTPVNPSEQGQGYPMPNPALPVSVPQTAAPADPMTAALKAVLDNAAVPGHQLPAPSWAAVAIFALVLSAVITFIVLGIEIGAALGALALIGMMAGYIRRNLA